MRVSLTRVKRLLKLRFLAAQLGEKNDNTNFDFRNKRRKN